MPQFAATDRYRTETSLKYTRLYRAMMTQEEISALLNQMADGDPSATSRLMPILYSELHRIATRFLRKERADHTLQPTALVHEAFLRMTAPAEQGWHGRTHFFATSACVMRQVLTDYARHRNAAKRGSGVRPIALQDAILPLENRESMVLDLDEALSRLQKFAPRQAKVVEMRFFAGMTMEEISQYLGVTGRTVNRDWQVAKAWLLGELGSESRTEM